MPEPTTGTKPEEQQTPQPGDADQGQTGTKPDQSVMPTDKDKPIIEDDPSVEKDGEKVVPFGSYSAEKEKRQAAEARIKELEGQQATPQEPQEPAEGETKPPEGEFNWDVFMQDIGQPSQPTQPPQPATQPQVTRPPQAFDMQKFNEELNEQIQGGDVIGAFARMDQFKTTVTNNMKRTARKWIKDYDNLPLNNVSDDEITAFQQNPEALRGLIAKAKGGSKAQPTPPPSVPSGDGGQPQNWDQVREDLKREGREEYIQSLTSQSGMSGEASRTGVPAAGDEYELGEDEKTYFRNRGYKEEQFPELARKLKTQQDRMSGRY